MLIPLIAVLGTRLVNHSQLSGQKDQPAEERPLQTMLVNQMSAFRQGIMQRAAISLADDFRSGLGDWEGEGDWAKRWSYDAAGFVRPGRLALYRPSLPLTDYTMEFLGQIERGTLSWVVRASDPDNYYAIKIAVAPAPVPKASIIRYPVIDGKRGPATKLSLSMPVRMDTLYHVRVSVRGEDITTTVQQQVVDHFSSGRLRRGGVGLFSENGEQSRVRWIEISHQYDALGRLCALLAPYDFRAGEKGFHR